MSSDRLIPRLLARRDRLARSEKDAIFESVIAEVAPPKRPKRWWLALAAPVVAAAIVLVVIAPWRSGEDEFRSRGVKRSMSMSNLTCTPRPCSRGSKLVFDTYGSTYPYLAAFAKRADGTVLWYFPEPDGTSAAPDENGIIRRGIVLGDEHTPGTYTVYMIFSNQPLTRAQIRDAFDERAETAGPGTSVITHKVHVR